MKRKLIQQMRNEWRSNIWMMVELAIVAIVVWAMFKIGRASCRERVSFGV